MSVRESESSDRLELFVNGEPQVLPAPCSVAGLLACLEIDLAAGQRVAVAVNRSVVARSRYADAALRAGDRVEILEAVGGG